MTKTAANGQGRGLRRALFATVWLLMAAATAAIAYAVLVLGGH
jgi:hypothetical protein